MSIGSIGSYSFVDRMVMNTMSRSSKAQGKEPDFSQMAANIIGKEDNDGNGTLSITETRLDSEMFKTADGDGDGQLTAEELAASLKNNPPRPMGPPPETNNSDMAARIIQEEDADGDGMISASETKVDSNRFNALDTDGDGLLTAEELTAAAENGPQGAQGPQGPMGPPPPMMDSSQMASSILENEDADGNGVLSVEETDLASAEFNTLDTNGDGEVTIDELQAALEARKAEREQEMAANALQSDSENSKGGSLQSLMQILANTGASAAYGVQKGLFGASQTSSKSLALSA